MAHAFGALPVPVQAATEAEAKYHESMAVLDGLRREVRRRPCLAPRPQAAALTQSPPRTIVRCRARGGGARARAAAVAAGAAAEAAAAEAAAAASPVLWQAQEL